MESGKDRNYLGNIYGLHDGYDGSVFLPNGTSKALTASVGGVQLIMQIYKFDKEKQVWKKIK